MSRLRSSPLSRTYMLLVFAMALSLLAGRSLAQEPKSAATSASTPHAWLDVDGKPLPFQSDDEILAFLQTADVVETKDIPSGVTHPLKLTLQQGDVRAHAVFRSQDIEKKNAGEGAGEVYFRDSYLFEPAAYQLNRMLGMHSVPPAATRNIHGRNGSVQIWVEKARTETSRVKNGLQDPNQEHWNKLVHIMRVFDYLVYNTDRTQENILITPDWNVYLIDHTRAFRTMSIKPDPKRITNCDRKVYSAMKSLSDAEYRSRLKPYLRGAEIDSILRRRKELVRHFDKLIAERGENSVLFTFD